MKNLSRIILYMLGISTALVVVYGIIHAIKGDVFILIQLVHERPILLFILFVIVPLVQLVLIVSLLILNRKEDDRSVLNSSLSNFYQSVFFGLSTGLMVLDQNGRIRYINPACCRLLGWDSVSPPQLVHYSELVDPLLVPISERLAASIETGDHFTREYRVFLPSGVMCIQCDFYSLRDSRLGLIFVISLEDRSREDAIKQKLSLQLEETHRYAISKDNFFANMSHEIRTPINAILGMTYFARNICKSEQCLEYIAKIENASELLLSVVNDILDFSKMQEHKFSLNPENFNLYDLKKILMDLFSLKAEQKGLTLLIDFDCPERFYVNGDQFRLTQVFMNLVSNAIKFTEKGFISVSLNHEIIGQEVILRCTVRDTGCGLSEDMMSKLFTDFEQFTQVLVKTHEGTGLGLAICKRLVELMHGVIWADSEVGKGSSFHFVVVMKKLMELSGADLTETLPKIPWKTGRVLVVEDNDINREIAETLLTSVGCTVERATNGLEAIDMCRIRPQDYYDLVLMDIHMPRMNGYDAARILKNELGIACPIIAITASSENSDSLEMNGDLISGYIIKPYDPEIFKDLFVAAPGQRATEERE